jgi:hypothetical protein
VPIVAGTPLDVQASTIPFNVIHAKTQFRVFYLKIKLLIASIICIFSDN